MPRPTRRFAALVGGSALLFLIVTNVQSGWLFVLSALLLGAAVGGMALPTLMLRGVEVTRLGRRHKAEGVVKAKNPRGDTVYWIGAAGAAQDAGHGTDFNAVASGRVSITPLQVDLTQYANLDNVRQWLNASETEAVAAPT